MLSLILYLILIPGLREPEPDWRGKGYLGVQLQENAEVQVTKVMPNTPAERAGLQEGDIILRVGDAEPQGLAETIREISQHRPGTVLRLEVKRGEQTVKLRLKVTIRPEEAGPVPMITPEPE